MATYHVWLIGQEAPEVVRAEELIVCCSGRLIFGGGNDGLPGRPVVRTFEPDQWRKWAVVHDEADHHHL